MKKNIFLLLTIFFVNILSAQTRVFPFKKNDKWGIIDENQKVIKEPFFENLYFFLNHDSEKALGYAEKNSKYGIVDRQGKTIIPFEYYYIKIWESINKAKIVKNQKAGVFDFQSEKIIIPIIYDEVSSKEKGKYFIIRKGSLVGVCDQKHKMIIPIKYQFASVYRNYKNQIELSGIIDGIETIYNTQGKIIDEYPERTFYVPQKFDNERKAKKTIATINIDKNKFGENVQLNKVVKNPNTNEIFGIIIKDFKFGLIDKNNSLLIPLEYNNIKIMIGNKNGLLVRNKNQLIGWFSLNEKQIVIPTNYSNIENATKYFFKPKDKKVSKNYLFVTSKNKIASGFTDIKTGQVFLPKE